MEIGDDIFRQLSIDDFRFDPISLVEFLWYAFVFFLTTETLLSWDIPDAVGRSTAPQSQCLCQTSNCLCCIDLNLTTAIGGGLVVDDLDGRACINIKQKEQNISLNLSYGDNPVHNATIKIGNERQNYFLFYS